MGIGGRQKENSIVLSKGISEKLQVSLRRFWLLCVLLSNPASLRGCHSAFISLRIALWIPTASPPHPHGAGAARLFTATAGLIPLTGPFSLLPFQSRARGRFLPAFPFPSSPAPFAFPNFSFFLRSAAKVLDKATRSGVRAQLNKNPSLRAAFV